MAGSGIRVKHRRGPENQVIALENLVAVSRVGFLRWAHPLLQYTPVRPGIRRGRIPA